MTLDELERLVRVHAARIQKQDDAVAALRASNTVLQKKLDLLDTRTKVPPMRRVTDAAVSMSRH